MFADILEPACQLSLITQKTSDVNIIKPVDAVDNTLTKYQVMKWRLEESDSTATAVLPTVKHVLSVIQGEGLSIIGQQHQYQGVVIPNLQQAKTAVDSTVYPNVEAIHNSLAGRYGSLLSIEDESSRETKDADEVAHSIDKLLNTRVWMKGPTENVLSMQIEALSHVFDSFKGMQPFSNTSKEVLQDQYISLVQYTTSYFDVPVIQPMDLWSRLHKLKQEDAPELWALIELCLCCPYGNAVCESFISYLRIVKTDWRNRLNEGNLSDLMKIKVMGPPLRDFHEKYGELAVDLWNGDKV